MVTAVKEKEKEQEKAAHGAHEMRHEPQKEGPGMYAGPTAMAGFSPAALITMGIVEILFGLIALALPVATSALLVVLLGGVLVVSGIIEFFSAFAKRSWGRFFYGILAMVAGVLVIAHPLFNLAFLTLLVSLYFIMAGIAQLASRSESGWVVASGVINIILGTILLFSMPAASLVAIAILVGINVLFAGFATLSLGFMRRKELKAA